MGILTRVEAAALTGRSASAVDLWAKAGHIEKVYVEGKVFYDRDSVEAYVSQVGPNKNPGHGGKKRKMRKQNVLVIIERNTVTIERLLSDNRKLVLQYKREAREEAKREVAAKLRTVLA